MLICLGLTGVVPDGSIFINTDDLLIYEDTSININGYGHVQNHYKLEITKFMSIFLLYVLL